MTRHCLPAADHASNVHSFPTCTYICLLCKCDKVDLHMLLHNGNCFDGPDISLTYWANILCGVQGFENIHLTNVFIKKFSIDYYPPGTPKLLKIIPHYCFISASRDVI